MNASSFEGHELSRARSEIAWFFGQSQSVMGLRGAGMEAGPASVWDEARSDRAHLGRLDVSYRAELAKRERIESTLLTMEPQDRKDLEAVYVPFGAARTSWQAIRVFSVGGRVLMALALRTREIRVAYARVTENATPPSSTELTLWVTHEVSRLATPVMPAKHRLRPALDAADARETAAAAAYDARRRVRVKEASDEREALLEAELAKLNVKLWGAR